MASWAITGQTGTGSTRRKSPDEGHVNKAALLFNLSDLQRQIKDGIKNGRDSNCGQHLLSSCSSLQGYNNHNLLHTFSLNIPKQFP